MKFFKRNIAIISALIIAVSMTVICGMPVSADDNVIVSWAKGEENLRVSAPVNNEPEATVEITDGAINVSWGIREAKLYEAEAKKLANSIATDDLGMRFTMTVNADKIESAGTPPSSLGLWVILYTASDDPNAKPVQYVCKQKIKLGKETDVILKFADFLDDNKDAIPTDKLPEITNIVIQTNPWDYYFGVSQTNVKFAISKVTSFKTIPTTTADPASTTLNIDQAAAAKVLDLYTKLPDDITKEFTYDEYIALEQFLEAYTELNDPTAEYLASEYQITVAVYTELLNLYNDMEVPEKDSVETTVPVETTVSVEENVPNEKPDIPNVNTGYASPIGILVIAAAAGVVIFKSRKK